MSMAIIKIILGQLAAVLLAASCKPVRRFAATSNTSKVAFVWRDSRFVVGTLNEPFPHASMVFDSIGRHTREGDSLLVSFYEYNFHYTIAQETQTSADDSFDVSLQTFSLFDSNALGGVHAHVHSQGVLFGQGTTDGSGNLKLKFGITDSLKGNCTFLYAGGLFPYCHLPNHCLTFGDSVQDFSIKLYLATWPMQDKHYKGPIKRKQKVYYDGKNLIIGNTRFIRDKRKYVKLSTRKFLRLRLRARST